LIEHRDFRKLALTALGIVGDNPALADVAREADQRLRAALSQLEKN